MRQVVGGARVAGGDVLAVFDAQGRLTRLASSYRPTRCAAGVIFVLTLDRRLRRRGDRARGSPAAQPGVAILGAPQTQLWLWPARTALSRAHGSSAGDPRPLGILRDAHRRRHRRVLSRENAAQRKGRTGQGIVFRSNQDYPDDASAEKIPGLVGAAQDPEGHLEGMRFAC
jgi:hypothetical protein